jgi:molybdate transport system substrate-binding protein
LKLSFRAFAAAFVVPLAAFLFLACSPAQAADSAKPLLVFGASSLTNALDEIGAAYTQQTGQAVKFSYAASSVLARQIEAGAKADLFFSADTEWMDYLQARNLINSSTRKDLLGNRLVLIAPASSAIQIKIGPGFPLAAALGTGRLSTGDPDSVPVGRYAKSALMTLGVWNSVADRIINADNVRTAMAFVSRGEAPLGIVYETDALVDKKVKVVDTFPASSHLPIVYPMAVTNLSQSSAAQFASYLRGPEAAEKFRKYGFTVRP